jgi:predicted LPLAT superfamily acyltransferase
LKPGGPYPAAAPGEGAGRKRGNRLGFWFFRAAMKAFGPGGAYGLLYIVCLYYVLVDRPLVAATRAYLSRRFPERGGVRQLFDAYRLFVNQGKCLIDRHAMAAGLGGMEIEIEGYDKIQNFLADQGKGFILLTAHVGNWQVAMTALRKFGKTVHLMMRPEDNAAVRRALDIGREEETVRIISTDDALGGVVEAMTAIGRGELVSIMGDRTYGYAACEAKFLGGEVRFPHGAFSIAAAAQCPVVVLLSAKVGKRKYVVDVSRSIPAPAAAREKRGEGIRASVREFARILEEYVMAHPFQWFVFRDVWKSNA